MPWLLRDGEVLASAELATSFRDRTRGLLGRDAMTGVIVLRPAKSVHTIGMRFPIDVAYCDEMLRVLRTARMRPWRLALPVWRARCIIEAEAGAFNRWGLRPGDDLEIDGA